MRSSVLMNFTIDKGNKKILVERGFDADVKLVWSAWTESKILDQWWAPKPYKAETKTMNFNEGGHWLYAMISPEGEKHWARADYKKIEIQKYYTAKDSFCDEDGKITKEFPGANWKVTFNKNNDTTNVNIELAFDDLNDLEQIIKMGFKEGFTAALTNLDELFDAKK